MLHLLLRKVKFVIICLLRKEIVYKEVALEIYNFDDCPISDRNGFYGGQAGSKEGIIFNGENWIVKYPKSTIGMRNMQISYTTSPISEYIGSHIYEILGYKVHETVMGIRNNKLVVACKDFCETPGELLEYRTLRNIYNEKIEEHERRTGSASSHSPADLEEIMINLDSNTILKNIPEAKERFWDCVVIDVMINNNDRNNGNWGVLKRKDKYVLAPIYDNGTSFSSKLSDEQIARILNNPDRLKQSVNTTRTAYSYKRKEVFARDLFKLDIEDLRKSTEKIIGLYELKKDDIKSFVDAIPEKFENFTVCSKENKELIKETIDLRKDRLLEPIVNLSYKHEKTEDVEYEM